MAGLPPFTPNNCIAITLSSTTATVALPTPLGNQCTIQSLAANAICFVRFGASTVTAVIPTGTKQATYPIPPGARVVLTVPANATHVATIGTTSDVIYLAMGNGQ